MFLTHFTTSCSSSLDSRPTEVKHGPSRRLRNGSTIALAGLVCLFNWSRNRGGDPVDVAGDFLEAQYSGNLTDASDFN